MVTEENCIMVEAGKLLDCLTIKTSFFAGATITENLMPIQNSDGCLGSTMQEIFTFVGGIHPQADIPQHLIQDFSKTLFFI